MNGTLISNGNELNLSGANSLRLIDVAYVKEGNSKGLKFVGGADKYSIWPGTDKN